MKRLRFRLSTLLLLIAVLGLAIGLCIAWREILALRQQAAIPRPLTPRDVLQQFEREAVDGKQRTWVLDCRYSTKEDVYTIDFFWNAPVGHQRTAATVELRSDGNGKYSGTIQSAEFARDFGFNRVVIDTPTPPAR
jgi:hypothetical protein